MLRTLFSSDFCTITFDEDREILMMEWKEATKMLYVEGFKENVELIAKFAKRYRPKGLLINAKRLHFVIAPQVQDWYQRNIMPCYMEAGLKKISIVMTEEFIANLSIKQVFEERPNPEKLHNSYFSEIQQAMAWLEIQAQKT